MDKGTREILLPKLIVITQVETRKCISPLNIQLDPFSRYANPSI